MPTYWQQWSRLRANTRFIAATETDIDTHDFGILDQLRGHFDHVISFLMDRATLDAHAAICGSEDKPLRVDLHRLTIEERTLYDDLRDNQIRAGLRLEQEHIGFHWLAHRLLPLDGTSAAHWENFAH